MSQHPITPSGPIKKISFASVRSNRKRGGDIRVVLSPNTVEATSGFGGVGTLAPGERVIEHYHPYSEEFVYVIEGELTLNVAGRETVIGGGEACMIPKGAAHRLVNNGDVPVRVVFHSSPLAPLPELGHVDLETPLTDEADPQVGGAP
ncbi:cupin domain-containing protein [Sinosporangium siamense]|uniref:Cupin n=1 Tax=Sinosporangium siamense TaxID=1367973 RepID=A0A919RLL4_9ACTN|nr:cupin domain-containing protein [Sinosporangium siamense]GII95075.1 cupin [Sinosporangium siamense]